MQFIDTINVKGENYQFQATYDSEGNKISSTYAKFVEVQGAISQAIGQLVNDAPEALDTLKELSAALGDDANFAATMTAELANKANSSDVYTKVQVDNIDSQIRSAIAGEVSNLSAEILKKSDKVNTYTKDDVYNKSEIDNIADTKANAADSYTKDVLYTKNEINESFALKSELHEIPEKVSHFINDAEYLVWSDVEHFAVEEEVSEALDTKVDKVEGMGLISNENTIKLQALPTAAQYEQQMQAYQQTLQDCADAVQAMGTNIDGAMQKNDAQDELIQANIDAILAESTLAREEEGKLAQAVIDEQSRAELAEKANADAIVALQEGKVDMVEGFGLSSNDYTAEDKELLQGLKGRVETLETVTAILEQFEALVTKVGELEAKIQELEAKHIETPENPEDPEAEPEA